MSAAEAWLIMLKRKDGEAYCGLHKSIPRFFLTEQEATTALGQFQFRAHYHVVPVVVMLADDYHKLGEDYVQQNPTTA